MVCWGCENDIANQLGHIGPGGCLEGNYQLNEFELEE